MTKRKTLTFVTFLVFALSLCLFTASFATVKYAAAETEWTMVGWETAEENEETVYNATGNSTDTHTMTLNSIGENNKITFDLKRGSCTSERYVNFIITSSDSKTLKMSLRFDYNAMYIHYNGNRLDGQNHTDVSADAWTTATIEFTSTTAKFSFAGTTLNGSFTETDFTNATLTIEADRILPSVKNINMEKVAAPVLPSKPTTEWTMVGWDLEAEGAEWIYDTTGDREDTHTMTLDSVGQNNTLKFDFRRGNLTGQRYIGVTITASDNKELYFEIYPYSELISLHYDGTELSKSQINPIGETAWNTATIEFASDHAVFTFAGITIRADKTFSDFTNASVVIKATNFLPSIKNLTLEKVVAEKPETDFNMLGWDITKEGEDVVYYATGNSTDTHTMTLDSIGENNKITFDLKRGSCTGERYVNFIITSVDNKVLKMSLRFDYNAMYIHYNGNRLDGQNHDHVSEGGYNQATIEFYKGYAKFSFVDVAMNKQYSSTTIEIADFTNAKFTIEADRILPSIRNLTFEKVEEPAGDKTQLNALIATAEAVEEDKYTTTSYAALKTALEEANALSETAVQIEVDAAYAALDTAYKALKLLGDKTQLNALIATVEALEEDKYTAESYAALETALEEANALSNDVTQEEVDEAYTALDNAYKALKLLGDKTQLNALIATVEALEEDKYTTTSYAALKTALEEANALSNDVTQEEVDAAYTALDNAYKALKLLGDKTQLNALIATVEALEEDKYTAESYAALETALEEANALSNDVTQEEVDEAYKALDDAYKALELKPGDKTQLNALIATVEALEEDKYTAESYAALETALEEANALSNKATQEEVDEAYKALDDAYKALELKPTTSDTDTSTDSDTPIDTDTSTDSDTTSDSFQTKSCTSGVDASSGILFLLGAVAVYVIAKRRKVNG